MAVGDKETTAAGRSSIVTFPLSPSTVTGNEASTVVDGAVVAGGAVVVDPLAEHLLLGRYNSGVTITVDLDPDGKGLSIEATEAKTPVEA